MKTPQVETPKVPTAYRGHVIRHNFMNGLYWAERDGFTITKGYSWEYVKEQLDDLLDDKEGK